MKTNKIIQNTVLVILILLNLTGLGAITVSDSKTSEKIQTFNITFSNNTVGNLDSYTGKPILLEWAASWCITCEDTQRAMKDLHPLYKDSSHFISISYGGSGDTIEKFLGMKNKGGYQWDFVMDSTNYASTIPIGPGSVWILDSNLNLIKDWRGVILTSNDIQNALNQLLNTGDQQRLLNPKGNTPGSFQADNPLFILFLILVGSLVLSIAVLKIKSMTKVVNVKTEILKRNEKVNTEITNLKSIINDGNVLSKSNHSPERKGNSNRRRKRR